MRKANPSCHGCVDLKSIWSCSCWWHTMFSSSSDKLYVEWCALKFNAKILAYHFSLGWRASKRRLNPCFPRNHFLVDRWFMPYIKPDHLVHSQNETLTENIKPTWISTHRHQRVGFFPIYIGKSRSFVKLVGQLPIFSYFHWPISD